MFKVPEKQKAPGKQKSDAMKLKVNIDEACEETTVIITAKRMTDEVNEVLSLLSRQSLGFL